MGWKKKRVKGVEHRFVNVETKNFKENILKYVDWKGDEKLKAQLANSKFTANGINYHAICQKEAEVWLQIG